MARWWQLGLSIEEILEELPTLQPAEVHAALAYYHLNKSEIDRYIQEELDLSDPAPYPSAKFYRIARR